MFCNVTIYVCLFHLDFIVLFLFVKFHDTDCIFF